MATVPFGWVAPAAGGASERVVSSPSSSSEPASRTDQRVMPRRAPLPSRRRRTVPTSQSSPSTLKPAARQLSGAAAMKSSSTVGWALIGERPA